MSTIHQQFNSFLISIICYDIFTPNTFKGSLFSFLLLFVSLMSIITDDFVPDF
jgi:hypothetical protein